MEASSAGLASAGDAGGDGGEGAGVLDANGNGNGHANGNGQAGDLSQLMETLSGLAEGQEEMRQWMSGRRDAAPFGELGEGGEAFDAGQWDLDGAGADGLDVGGETPEGFAGEAPDGGDVDADVEEMTNAFTEATQGMIAEAVGPQLDAVRSELQAERDERAYQQLAAELPELGDRGVMAEVAQCAQDFAQVHGLPPSLMSSAPMIRLIYLAGRATEMAEEESELDADGAARLEGSGSAGSGQQPKNLLSEMAEAGRDGGLGKDVLRFG